MEHMSLTLRGGFGRPSWNRKIWGTALRVSERRRRIHIRPARTEQVNALNGSSDIQGVGSGSAASSPDARFELLGNPYSLLSATLTPSQNLYTRRGTLVGLKGKADNVVSTLRILEPFRRALLQIPFLYQKISSTSPVTALVSVRAPTTSFAIIQLDGTVDWVLSQRKALLAWTGHSLGITPLLSRHLSLAHWGSSQVTGRGLVAVVGKGQVYTIDLEPGEHYVAHPSNVLAYTRAQQPPQPYRFKSTAFKLQVPDLGLATRLKENNFIRNMAHSDTWKSLTRIAHVLRTWSRRTIWGDRLFLRFEGPARLLVQSRGARLNDVLTNEEVNEIADTPPGVTREAVAAVGKISEEAADSKPTSEEPQVTDTHEYRQGYMDLRQGGNVEFRETRPPRESQQ